MSKKQKRVIWVFVQILVVSAISMVIAIVANARAVPSSDPNLSQGTGERRSLSSGVYCLGCASGSGSSTVNSPATALPGFSGLITGSRTKAEVLAGKSAPKGADTVGGQK